MKIALILCSYALMVLSCNSKQDYLNHKLEYVKKPGTCSDNGPTSVKMISNIIGERFVFSECLSSTYKGEYKAARHGDTVVISFDKPSGIDRQLYELTLDIDAYPYYHHIDIDGQNITLSRSEN